MRRSDDARRDSTPGSGRDRASAFSFHGGDSARERHRSCLNRARAGALYFRYLCAEVTTPGAILPRVAGAIALLLFLFMAAILPVNVTGLVLIALALALFIFD